MAEELQNDIDDSKELIPEVKIPEELVPVIKDLPKKKQQEIVKAIVSVSIKKQLSSFKGPLPPPEVISGYNDVVRNGGERIFSMAENQSNHRIKLEDFVIREELKLSGRGQIFGFIIGLIGLGLATGLALLGHETLAGIFGTSTILGMVTVFVIGKKAQEKDISEKE